MLLKNITEDGSYFNSRMIGEYVYVISVQQAFLRDGEIAVPGYSGSAFPEISYFDVPDASYAFNTITSVNVQTGESNKEVFLLGSTNNLYVSSGNIYITSVKRMREIDTINQMIDEVILPSVPADIALKIKEIRAGKKGYEMMQGIGDILQNYTYSLTGRGREDFMNNTQQKMIGFQEKIAKQTELTLVHKIGIGDGRVEYKYSAEVPGTVLNQFSMDEYNGYFRIATTTGSFGSAQNHIYVLDDSLNVVGRLEDLAKGESIYSARFAGNRAYLVTFKKVDPLFVIDLSEPAQPKVLGELKIPGYSDYLHPYDENHIIGIGKEATEQGDFAWYQGLKLSLFDVSDVENPIEISKYNIGDRGSDSYALRDHKAFLFSKDKNLLMIPALVAEIDESEYPEGVPPSAFGVPAWQGAYVFGLDLNGFALKGRITHNDKENITSRFYYYNSPYAVKRSLYIGNVLYTMSGKMLKANDLSSMDEISAVELPYEEIYPYIIERGK